MKIAKEFSWEMGHRLPFHNGKCKNLHGHSYQCMIELTGDVDKNGIVLDYYDLKKAVEPVFEELDHAFMVWEGDKELIDALNKLNSTISYSGSPLRGRPQASKLSGCPAA